MASSRKLPLIVAEETRRKLTSVAEAQTQKALTSTDYLYRAAAGWQSMYVNTPAEAYYPAVYTDADDETLDGSKGNYQLRNAGTDTDGECTAATTQFHREVTKMVEDPVKADEVVPGNRLRAGAAIFVTGQLAPLAIPLVTNSSLPATWKSVLSGVLLLGVPELAIVLTVIVLGKAGFNELKARIWKLFRRTVLPREVSRGRYYAGLVVFLIPILIGWLLPYLYESAPSLLRYRLTVAIVGDVALIAGLCLLGGQFWDKIRALFVYDARATFPPVSSHDPDETH